MKAKFLPSAGTGRWLLVSLIVGVLGLAAPVAACTSAETAVNMGVTTATQTVTTNQSLTAIDISTSMKAAPSGAQSMHWERLSVKQDAGSIRALIMDPINPSILYAGTDEGLFKSSDGAESWSRLSTPAGGAYAISIDPASPSTVYAAFYLGTDNVRPTHLLRSDDGGFAWVDLSDEDAPKLGGYALPEVWFDRTTTPSTAYILAFGEEQVYRSTDRGETWTALTSAEHDKANVLRDAARSKAAVVQQALDAFLASVGGYYGQGSSSLVTVTDADTGATVLAEADAVIIDPDHPLTFYVPAGTGYASSTEYVYKSVDGGKTWRKASAGLVDSLVWMVVVDPSDPSTLYAAAPGGIFKSSDGGTTWSVSLVAPVSQGSVVIAPSSPSTLYAWTPAGLYRTDDDGANWSERGGTLVPIPSYAPGTAVGSLVLGAADNPDIVFATTDRLFRSTNRGSSWYQVLGGASSADGQILLVADPHNLSTLFAALPGSSAVLKSTDTGATWTPLPMQWNDPVADIAMDPHSSSAIYVIKYHAGTRTYALSRSPDGGATWQKVELEGAAKHMSRLLLDPRSPDMMYAFTDAGSASSALYRSTDRGATWTNITGELAAPLAQSTEVGFVIDPGSSEGLYAVTSQGLFKWVSRTD